MGQKHEQDERSNKAAELLETFKAICSEAGLKLKHQRLEIFRVLTCSTDHPSVEDVFERVKQSVPTIALDTVYRTLTMLEQHEVLGKLQLDMRARYDPNIAVHHHFFCIECKENEDFYWPVFDRMKLPTGKSLRGRVNSKRIEVRGICPVCLKRKRGLK